MLRNIFVNLDERGYTARLQFSDIVDEEVNKMKNKYYGEMATKIQARWRGYHTRNYKHNFKARKQYLEVGKLLKP